MGPRVRPPGHAPDGLLWALMSQVGNQQSGERLPRLPCGRGRLQDKDRRNPSSPRRGSGCHLGRRRWEPAIAYRNYHIVDRKGRVAPSFFQPGDFLDKKEGALTLLPGPGAWEAETPRDAHGAGGE